MGVMAAPQDPHRPPPWRPSGRWPAAFASTFALAAGYVAGSEVLPLAAAVLLLTTTVFVLAFEFRR